MTCDTTAGITGEPYVAAIILAAGSSSRMGQPKSELTYAGETFLSRLVRLFGRVCADVIVVHSRPAAIDGARVVINPDPTRGMFSSLQCGMAAVAAEAAGVAFTPVDYPAIRESTVEFLIRHWHGESLRIPRYNGRRGHPVVMRMDVAREILAMPASSRASDIVHAHEGDIVYVDVDDPGIVRDVDTPADYEALR